MIASSPEIVLLGGDGIGPEVVTAAATVVKAVLPRVLFIRPLHGEAAVAECGEALPPATRLACRAAQAVLFGACHERSRPVLRFLRWGLETYANLRPARTLPGLPSPLVRAAPIDLLVVRENLEGEYPERAGQVRELAARWPGFTDALGRPLPEEGLFTARVTTERGCRRIAQAAAAQARRRRARGLPGKVTIVTKANVLSRTDGLFRGVAQEVLGAARVPHDHLHVDDAARRLVAAPESFDVLLCPNLYGDVLSDVAAELTGGIGVAPSGCIGDGRAYFEPVHGAAPDLAGKGIANPLATVLSAGMMLDHLGYEAAARALEEAVGRLLTERRALTPDLGGTAGTAEVAAELVEIVRRRRAPATVGAEATAPGAEPVAAGREVEPWR